MHRLHRHTCILACSGSTEFAFAALKESGQVVTWGDASVGGDSSSVAQLLQSGIVNIWANAGAFVAAKSDGSLVMWGDPSAGGDMNALNQDNMTERRSCISFLLFPAASFAHHQEEARDVETLFCNIRAFAAIAQGRACAAGLTVGTMSYAPLPTNYFCWTLQAVMGCWYHDRFCLTTTGFFSQ